MAGLDWIVQSATSIIERNPPRQGRAVLYPDGSNRGPSPQQLCGLFIGMMWERLYGRWPVKSKLAQRWCDAWWKAAGGPPRSGWGRDGAASVIVWRIHLTAAREFRPPHPAGSLVQRHFLNKTFPSPRTSSKLLPPNFYDHPVSIANRAKKNQK